MRFSRPKWMIRQFFRIFFLTIVSILILVTLVTFISTFFPVRDRDRDLTGRSRRVSPPRTQQYLILPLSQAPERHITISKLGISSTKPAISSLHKRNCAFQSCFDIYRCGRLGQDRLTVFVYPIERIFVNGIQIQHNLSQEFYQIIQTIVQSPHYVSDPNQACVFVPSIDLLNLSPFLKDSSPVSMEEISLALQGLDYWGEDGANHILFSMFPNSDPLTKLSSAAILASSSFFTTSYRLGFHIPFLTFNPYGIQNLSVKYASNPRKIFCLDSQGSKSEDIFQEDVLLLDYCKHNSLDYRVRCKDTVVYPYPEVLAMAEFCIVHDLSSPTLWDVMSAGCVPVIYSHHYRLPFDEMIDWSRNAILLYDHQLPEIGSILRSVSVNRKKKLQAQVQFTFQQYFQSVPHLVSAVFNLMKERVFPHSARTIQEWNASPTISQKSSPIFNPIIAPKSPGFTAVILAYERIQSLFQVIERLGAVTSLAKILVVWNNQVNPPPPEHSWPKISKSLKVIQTKENKMSNRFYPYDEIHTEAVIALDDDIVMLTADEIDFAFRVWSEFPDRLVGFPSRSHVWDNSTSRWRYESEWTNEISMVLTGAAFYHKYWHYAYFNEMPEEIRDAVDKQMNCEDISMNFLIANRTGKPPIKVAPRKKFKCPTCSNNEMLSADTSHMRERTDCINYFAKIFGYMPLQPIEYRADPVLFKVEALPKKLKKFRDIGSL